MERYKMFPQTRESIAKRAKELKTAMEDNTESLRGLDSTRDGDMMDDPLMHSLLDRRLQLEGEFNQLSSYLNTDSEVITATGLKGKTTVSVGHEVRMLS